MASLTRNPSALAGGTPLASMVSSASSLEGLKSGVDSLFTQLAEEKVQLQRQVDSLRAECVVWKSSYLELDSERDLWRAKLAEIESQIARLTSSGTSEMSLETSQDGVLPHRSGESAAQRNEKSTYMLALIDVETICFSRSLLKKGREGGKRAASLLTDALTARSETNGGSKDGGWSLVAFAFVDRFELGRFVMAEGVLGSWTMLDEFVLGFNGAASGVLSLVDTAREDVPRKLSSHLKHFATDGICSKVVLATSEVGRYKRLLLGLKSTAVFVAGCDPAKSEGFPTMLVPGLFSRGLSAKRSGEEVYRPTTPDTVIHSPGPAEERYFFSQASNGQRSASLSRPLELSSTSVRRPCSPETDQEPPSSPVRPAPQSPESWTTVVSKVKSKQVKAATAAIPLAPAAPAIPTLPSGARALTSRANSGRGSLNAGSRPEVISAIAWPKPPSQPSNLGAWERAQWAEYKKDRSKQELEAYKFIKSLDPRPCHQHYLSGRTCDHLSTCIHRHDYKLSPVQLTALASIAKEVLCPSFRWGKCKKPESECLHAHHCPFGNNCPFEGACWFPEHASAGGGGESDSDVDEADPSSTRD